MDNADVNSNKTCASLTVDDVYDIAKSVGSEVERLIDAHGAQSAAGLVPKIVKVLELLESFASRSRACDQEELLLKAVETLRLQQNKRRAAKEDADVGNHKNEIQELQQKEDQWRRRCEELQAQVQQLQGDKQDLEGRLKGSHAQEDRVQRQEREVMLKLKDVVDKQRDELRAKVQQISTISTEVEALQEQLERFMKMNGELRHRQTSSPRQTSREQPESLGADQPCFTKKEVRDILFERNELKANLFLVQEELKYYQREILNDERFPSFVLDAVHATIRKQRKLIKAKMLGIPVDEVNSDEEEKAPSNGQTETDGPVEKPAESRIRNLFGFLTRSGSNRSPTHMNSSSSTWEIIGDTETSEDSEQDRST
ncbi:RILP-like protein 1 [Merluccius polli]|uniref:RILP-like protein 2 n=1 Tax=Merluccius polli TaxID=89951 RepID=A0AA47MH79_MERPO|nr:RILP-like protein 1 [Merluccius polli]